MKDVAPPAEARKRAVDPVRAQAREPRPAGPTPDRTPLATPVRDARGPSVLDRLRRARLSERFEAAASERAQDLPGRADLERRFGTSLSHVSVHSGPAARSLLDHLGARGAASGSVILLRDGADSETAAHEVAHVLQSDGGGEVSAPLEAAHPAEIEAERVARSRGAARVGVRLRRGALALRRANTLTPPRADPTASPRIKTESLTYADPGRGAAGPDEAVLRRGRARAPPAHDQEETPERDPAAAEGLVPEPRDAEGGATAEGRGPEKAGTPEAGADAEAGPDRQAELQTTLDESQETWDQGAGTAGEHTVETCSKQANQPGTRAFHRGPQLDVPAKKTAAPSKDPELDEVDEKELKSAKAGLDEQVAKAPARGPPVDSSGLDEEQRRERDQHRAKLKRRIASKVGEKAIQRSTAKKVKRTGTADPKRVSTLEASAESRTKSAESAAEQGTKEDFGEDKLAPHQDPTIGHDRELNALDVPKVDVAGRVEASRLQRVGTRANAGGIPIDEVVLVQDHELAAQQEAVAAQRETEKRIDEGIAKSDTRFERDCRASAGKRREVQAQARGGVKTRRETWAGEAKSHVAGRRKEAQALTKQKLAHVDKLEADANGKSEKVLQAADKEAATKLKDAEVRSQEKAKETEDKSWWQQGIDAIKSLIDTVVGWIDTFIEACHRAIDVLLDAASVVAHAFVEAGHKAVTATIDGLKDGLDFIADNLPGELGDIAREHRDDVHEFLDGAQKKADEWAADLHASIDEGIEDLRRDLHEGLDDLQEDVHDAADTLKDVLENGLMPFLRAKFPALAALIDEGLAAPIQRAADTLGEWVRGALDGTGLGTLQTQLDELHDETFCQPETEEEQEAACEAFKQKLDSASQEITAFMDSPFVSSIRDFFQGAEDDKAGQQVDAASGFFTFIQLVAKPVYDWWQGVKPMVDAALELLGDIANDIWLHVAVALGIDPSLTPLQALEQGLNKLWEAVSEAVAPLIQAIKDAWSWIKDDSPIAPVIEFFAKLPEAWDALKDLASRAGQGAVDWVVETADALAETVLPVVDSALQAASSAAHSVIGAIEGWVTGLIGALDAVLGWTSAVDLVQAILTVISAVLTPIRVALQLFKDCVIRGMRALADGLKSLARDVKKLMDIAAGIALALATFPVGVVMFLAGNVWLHVIPDCYKAPILNFFLDRAIDVLELFPEPAEIGMSVVYNGVLNFLLGLRNAPDPKKVAAMNLFASIYAGSAEVLAGLFVGIVEGVWEGTVGTVIFLIEIVVWILSLPFKLAKWAVDRLTGKSTDEDEDEAPEPETPEPKADDPATLPAQRKLRRGDIVVGQSREDADAAAAERARTEAAQADAIGAGAADADPGGGYADAEATALDAENDLFDEAPEAREPSQAILSRVVHGSPAEREQEAREARYEQEPEPNAAAEGETVSRLERVGPAAPQEDEQEALESPESHESPQSYEPYGPETELEPREPEPAGVFASEVDEESEEAGPGPEALEADLGASAQPPPAPGELGGLQAALEQLMNEGITREDVQQAMDGARAALKAMVASLAQKAAGMVLDALNAGGAAFALGRLMGSIVGQALVEILIAVLTAGAGAGVSVAKGVLKGTRLGAKLAGTLNTIRKALEPALAAVAKIKGAIGKALGSISKWFDDVLDWIRGIKKRAPKLGPKGRPRGLPRRPGRPRRRGRPRTRKPRGPRRPHPKRRAMPKRSTKPRKPTPHGKPKPRKPIERGAPKHPAKPNRPKERAAPKQKERPREPKAREEPSRKRDGPEDKGKKKDKDADHKADKKQRMPQAKAAAKAISDTMELKGRSVGETLAALQGLRLRYRFIRGFDARPAAGGLHAMVLRGSEEQFDTFDPKNAERNRSSPKTQKSKPKPRKAAPKKQPPTRGKARIDKDADGLTQAQRDWYRDEIDRLQAISQKKADALRFKRYRQGLLQKQGREATPEAIKNFQGGMSRAEHRKLVARNREAGLRGLEDEAAVVKDLKIKNNNSAGGRKQYADRDRFRGKSRTTRTRPDADTPEAILDVKSTKSPVLYRTRQIRAQVRGAKRTAREHATVITGGPASNVKPSGPLAKNSRVFHRDPKTKAWSLWDNASGKWKRISRKEARELVRFK